MPKNCTYRPKNQGTCHKCNDTALQASSTGSTQRTQSHTYLLSLHHLLLLVIRSLLLLLLLLLQELLLQEKLLLMLRCGLWLSRRDLGLRLRGLLRSRRLLGLWLCRGLLRCCFLLGDAGRERRLSTAQGSRSCNW